MTRSKSHNRTIIALARSHKPLTNAIVGFVCVLHKGRSKFINSCESTFDRQKPTALLQIIVNYFLTLSPVFLLFYLNIIFDNIVGRWKDHEFGYSLRKIAPVLACFHSVYHRKSCDCEEITIGAS